MQQRDAVGFGSAVGDFNVVGRRAGIKGGDLPPQFERAVRLRVRERLTEKVFTILLGQRELLHAQGFDAALREIPGDLVFPDRLEPFHRKRFETHEGRVRA
jgi:hypothetical protein